MEHGSQRLAELSLDQAELTERILREVSAAVPQYTHLAPEQLTGVRATVERLAGAFIAWLIDGRALSDEDLAHAVRSARKRAGEGIPLEAMLRAYRLAARVGYNAIAEAAQAGDAELVARAADLTMHFSDRLSTAVTEAYLADGRGSTSEGERNARALLEAAIGAGDPVAEEVALEQRVGIAIPRRAEVFAIGLGPSSASLHAATADRLRAAGVLAVTEGSRVVGLAAAPVVFGSLGLGAGARWTVRSSVPRPELGPTLDELRLVIDLARRRELSGEVRSDDALPELLLATQPMLAQRVRVRVLGPLEEAPELVHTLCVLLEHDLDRGDAARALHVHRNTLLHRIQRIEELTGLRLDRVRDLALLYLATTEP